MPFHSLERGKHQITTTSYNMLRSHWHLSSSSDNMWHHLILPLGCLCFWHIVFTIQLSFVHSFRILLSLSSTLWTWRFIDQIKTFSFGSGKTLGNFIQSFLFVKIDYIFSVWKQSLCLIKYPNIISTIHLNFVYQPLIRHMKPQQLTVRMKHPTSMLWSPLKWVSP